VGFGFRQVDAGIDAQRLGGVIHDGDFNGQPLLRCQPNRIGQVIFALGGKRDAFQRLPEPFRPEAVHPGVQLADGKLFRRGMSFLDDCLHHPAPVSHHPAKPAGIGGQQGKHADGTTIFRLRLHKRLQCAGGQQGHVGVHHQHQVRCACQQGTGGHDGMRRTELLLLPDAGSVIAHHRLHLVAAMTNHHHWRLVGQLAGGFQHMADERLACQRVQHLGQAGFHPDALSGSQNDNGNVHGRLLLNKPSPVTMQRGAKLAGRGER